MSKWVLVLNTKYSFCDFAHYFLNFAQFTRRLTIPVIEQVSFWIMSAISKNAFNGLECWKKFFDPKNFFFSQTFFTIHIGIIAERFRATIFWHLSRGWGPEFESRQELLSKIIITRIDGYIVMINNVLS